MKTVVFVCIHNSGRSQMAEAFFNRLTEGKARALSAGTDPGTAVDATVVEAMREAGIDIGDSTPKALTVEKLEQADKVVTMGCGVESVCPATKVETEDWELEDPMGKTLEEVRKIRNEVRARVVALLEKMVIVPIEKR